MAHAAVPAGARPGLGWGVRPRAGPVHGGALLDRPRHSGQATFQELPQSPPPLDDRLPLPGSLVGPFQPQGGRGLIPAEELEADAPTSVVTDSTSPNQTTGT